MRTRPDASGALRLGSCTLACTAQWADTGSALLAGPLVAAVRGLAPRRHTRHTCQHGIASAAAQLHRPPCILVNIVQTDARACCTTASTTRRGWVAALVPVAASMTDLDLRRSTKTTWRDCQRSYYRSYYRSRRTLLCAGVRGLVSLQRPWCRTGLPAGSGMRRLRMGRWAVSRMSTHVLLVGSFQMISVCKAFKVSGAGAQSADH